MEKVAERFQFMSRMIQKLDTNYVALQRENMQLVQKFNGERQLNMQLKQQVNAKFAQVQKLKEE